MQAAQKLYVLGHPVAHSKSPVMHNAVYRALGLSWEYGKADLPEEMQAQAFLDERDFVGINITTPYKPLALAAASWVHPLARLAKGANVLVNNDGALHAYNTDGMGCVRYLESQGLAFDGARVVVCGTGPTSFSIAGAAVMAGAHVRVLGRDALRAQDAVTCWCAECGLENPVMQGGSYAESLDIIAAADAIIDATPLGMQPGDPAPFDTSTLRCGQWVFDAVYGHGETALAKAAVNAGCEFRSGEGMLVGQAVLAVQLFLQAAGVEDSLGFERMAEIMHQAALGE